MVLDVCTERKDSVVESSIYLRLILIGGYMKGHLYKFTIEHIEDSKGEPINADLFEFETRNHDDIFKIVNAMKNKGQFDADDATALAVGIKLLREVMLKKRKHQIFKD